MNPNNKSTSVKKLADTIVSIRNNDCTDSAAMPAMPAMLQNINDQSKYETLLSKYIEGMSVLDNSSIQHETERDVEQLFTPENNRKVAYYNALCPFSTADLYSTSCYKQAQVSHTIYALERTLNEVTDPTKTFNVEAVYTDNDEYVFWAHRVETGNYAKIRIMTFNETT